jgi:spermidine synthase
MELAAAAAASQVPMAYPDPPVFRELSLAIEMNQTMSYFSTNPTDCKYLILECSHRNTFVKVKLLFAGPGYVYFDTDSYGGAQPMRRVDEMTRIKWTQYSWMALDPVSGHLAIFESWKTLYPIQGPQPLSHNFLFNAEDAHFCMRLFKINAVHTAQPTELIWGQDHTAEPIKCLTSGLNAQMGIHNIKTTGTQPILGSNIQEGINILINDFFRPFGTDKHRLFFKISAFHTQGGIAIVYMPTGEVQLFLDEMLQSSSFDESLYHSALVRPALDCALNNHPFKADGLRVLIMGGGEGGTARDVHAQQCVRECVMCEIDQNVIDMCKTHMPGMAGTLEAHERDGRLTLIIDDVFALLKDPSRVRDGFDVIIGDLSDPRDGEFDKGAANQQSDLGLTKPPASILLDPNFYMAIRKALKPHGFLSMYGGVETIIENKQIYERTYHTKNGIRKRDEVRNMTRSFKKSSTGAGSKPEDGAGAEHLFDVFPSFLEFGIKIPSFGLERPSHFAKNHPIQPVKKELVTIHNLTYFYLVSNAGLAASNLITTPSPGLGDIFNLNARMYGYGRSLETKIQYKNLRFSSLSDNIIPKLKWHKAVKVGIIVAGNLRDSLSNTGARFYISLPVGTRSHAIDICASCKICCFLCCCCDQLSFQYENYDVAMPEGSIVAFEEANRLTNILPYGAAGVPGHSTQQPNFKIMQPTASAHVDHQAEPVMVDAFVQGNYAEQMDRNLYDNSISPAADTHAPPSAPTLPPHLAMAQAAVLPPDYNSFVNEIPPPDSSDSDPSDD